MVVIGAGASRKAKDYQTPPLYLLPDHPQFPLFPDDDAGTAGEADITPAE